MSFGLSIETDESDKLLTNSKDKFFLSRSSLFLLSTELDELNSLSANNDEELRFGVLPSDNSDDFLNKFGEELPLGDVLFGNSPATSMEELDLNMQAPF